MKNKGILRRLTAAAAAVSMMCGAFAGIAVTAAGDKDYELIITEETGFDANMAKAMGFSFSTNNIWGPAFITDVNSVKVPSGRFTEKVSTEDVDIFELIFANDTVNNPDGKTFTGGKYVFETEFAAMYTSTGHLSLSLNGTTDTLVNARIGYSGSTSTNKGTLAFFDADGNAIGSSSEFTMSNLAAKNNQSGIAASMQHLMVEVDLRNNTFSAWHSVVKTMDGSTESEYKTFAASDDNKIVDNQPLNASGATELVSFSTASHINAGTNGFWIHSVSLEAGANTPETPPAETFEPVPEETPEPGLIDEVDFSDITVANNTVDGWEYYDKDSKAETLPNISFAKSSNSLVMKKTGTDGETDYSERYRAMYRFKEVVASDENSKTFVSDLQGKYKIVTEVTPKIQSGSQFQSVVPAMGDAGGNPTIAFSMCINPSNNVTEYIASDNKPVIYGSSINNTTAKLEYEVDTETGIITVSINGAAPYTVSKTYPGKALHGIMYVLKSKALVNDMMTIKSLKLYRTEGETAPNAAAAAAAALTTDMLTDSPNEITGSLKALPTVADGAEIEWSSSNTAIIGNDGKLAAQPLDGDVPVTMTAKLTKDGYTAYKTFGLTVKKLDTNSFKTLDNMDFTDENDTVFTDNGGTHSVTGDGTIVLSRTSSSQSPKVRLYPSWGDKQFAATGLWVFETEVNMMDSKYQKAEIVLYDESGARITSFYTTNKNSGNAVLTGVSRPSASADAVHTELDSGSKSGMNMRIRAMFDTETQMMSIYAALNGAAEYTPIAENALTREDSEKLSYIDIAANSDNNQGDPSLCGSIEIKNVTLKTVDSNKLSLADKNMNYGGKVEALGGIIKESVSLKSDVYPGTSVQWTSSNPEILTSDGQLNTGAYKEDTPVTLTYRLSLDGTDEYIEKTYDLTAIYVDKNNIAINKTADTGKIQPLPGHSPSKAVDGATSTWWQTMRFSDLPSFTVDLGRPEVLTKLIIYEAPMLGGYPISGYTIETSKDGKTWKQVSSGTKIGEDPVETAMNYSVARYVRFTVTSKDESSCVGLRELMVYSAVTNEEKAKADLELLKEQIGDLTNISTNKTLPTSTQYGSTVTYSSSLPSAFSDTGVVTQTSAAQSGKLKLVVKNGDDKAEGEIPFTVSAKASISGGGTGGGGSTGGSSYNGSAIPAYPKGTAAPISTAAPQTGTYKDVPKYFWAYDYIESLTAKGIISGDGSGEYRPNDSISRREFVKILLTAFGIDTSNTTNPGFTDVDENDWSYKYVAKAVELGIVNGVSENEFAKNSPITREDIAVMCERAMKSTGRTLDFAAGEFADSESISDYAAAAVSAMSAAGIIGGYDDNTFRPKNNATRAETAKIIYMLIKGD